MTGTVDAGPVTARQSVAPLSPAQFRLWFTQQLSPNPHLYNIADVARVPDNVDRDALSVALRLLVARHPSLRTTFHWKALDPVQVVGAAYEVGLPVRHCTSLPEGVVDGLRSAARTTFDLSAGPLLQAELVATADGAAALILNMHHIVTDGWSYDILWRELATCYEAIKSGAEPKLVELPIQYSDYAVWARSRPYAVDLAYWTRTLEGVAGQLRLPGSPKCPAVKRGVGTAIPVAAPEETVRDLRRLATSRRTTVFTVLAAAFSWVLGQAVRTADVVIATSVSGRCCTALENLVGFFVNTVPLRTRLDVECLDVLIGRVRDTVLEAMEHADVPYDQVVKAVAPPRSRSYPPLCQVRFVLEYGEERSNDWTRLPPYLPVTDTWTVREDMLLLLRVGRRLEGYLVYDRGAVSDAMAQQLACRFGLALQDFRAGTLPAFGGATR